MATPRRFLLYCPAKGSQYAGEFLGPDRLYDVALNDWTGVGDGLNQADYVFTEQGHKWPCIAVNLSKLHRSYDFYAFFDYDIEISAPALNRLFLTGEALGLDLFQAGLGKRSHCSHQSLFAQERSLARPVPFVEIMMPVFSHQALQKCAHTFSESESGYGLDHLWAELLDRQDMAVVDAVVAEHPRPVQSHHWRTSAGLTPMDELAKIASKFDLPLQSPSETKDLSDAVKHCQEGSFDAADAACRRALQADPDNPDALNMLGALSGQRGQWQEAFKWIGRAVILQPENAVYVHNCGFVLERMGREIEALVFYRHAVELNPNYPEARSNLEKILRRFESHNSGSK